MNDGTIGSACGACAAGLECVTDTPGGYCTRACATPADCGPAALCYTSATGQGCLRACQRDQDCRVGYACQGEAGDTVCYPCPAPGCAGEPAFSPDAGTPAVGGTCGAELFAGWWGLDPCGGSGCEQYHFLEAGTFEYEAWNIASGTIPYSGTWAVACPNLAATFSYDGSVREFVIRDGSLYERGEYRYALCRNARCF